MRVRALLWCGYVKPARVQFGRHASHGEHPDYDFAASVHDLELAIAAAHTLGIAARDVHAFVCRDDLLPPGFGGGIHPPTCDALSQLTTSLARSSKPEDPLLFLASNHGEREGLFVTAPVDEFADPASEGPSYLTPEDLAGCLDALSGPQLLVIATCFAGIFLPLGERPNRAVLTACSAEERYYVEDEETPHSPFLHVLLGKWRGAVLPGRPPIPCQPLADAFAGAEIELVVKGRARPHARGSVAGF